MVGDPPIAASFPDFGSASRRASRALAVPPGIASCAEVAIGYPGPLVGVPGLLRRRCQSQRVSFDLPDDDSASFDDATVVVHELA
jgi:hypothetical protein